ncbi:hypothetical protein ACUODF_17740, partial [Escherichia coli]
SGVPSRCSIPSSGFSTLPLTTILAFTLSLDDLVIASFVSGPGATTLPMLVFSSVRMGVNPEINALATLILGAVGIVGFIAWYLMARAEKQRIRDIQRARHG